LERLEFERLVKEALDELPDELHSQLENVAISVDDWPTKYQIVKAGLTPPVFKYGLPILKYFSGGGLYRLLFKELFAHRHFQVELYAVPTWLELEQ
jgi:predicted Zn-dependent protease with MMP-like domain